MKPDQELEAELQRKPEATEYDPVFENTFTDSRRKWLKVSTIFLGLKRGKFQWERLPKHVQAAVERWLKSPEFH